MLWRRTSCLLAPRQLPCSLLPTHRHRVNHSSQLLDLPLKDDVSLWTAAEAGETSAREQK